MPFLTSKGRHVSSKAILYTNIFEKTVCNKDSDYAHRTWKNTRGPWSNNSHQSARVNVLNSIPSFILLFHTFKNMDLIPFLKTINHKINALIKKKNCKSYIPDRTVCRAIYWLIILLGIHLFPMS